MTCSRPAATAWARSTRSSSTRRQAPRSGCSSRLDDGAAFVPLAGASVEERVDPRRPGRRARPGRAAARGRRDAERGGQEAPVRALRARVLPGGVPDRAARGRDHGGAAAAAQVDRRAGAGARGGRARGGGAAAARGGRRAEGGRAEGGRGAEGRGPAADAMAPRNLSDATPSPLPPRKPEVLPPAGGFVYEVEESSGLEAPHRDPDRARRRDRGPDRRARLAP